MKLNLKKPIRTRGGLRVEVYKVLLERFVRGGFQIHGAFENGEGKWIVAEWTIDGGYTSDKQSSLDIINV